MLIDGLGASAAQRKRVDGPAGCRRASIAAIFRASNDGEQILFIRRAVNPKDPWSGHVALPGGRQDAADCGDDEATAIRETSEEVGLALRSPVWHPLGRLADDRVIYPRGRTMIVSIFGFVATNDQDAPPTLRLQPTEVADAWWVDTRVLRPERLCWRRVTLEGLLNRKLRAAPVLRAIGCSEVDFPAIPLPPPATAEGLHDGGAFQLWGLTLGFLSEVSRTALGLPLVGKGAPRGYGCAYRATGGPLAQLVLHTLFGMPSLRPRLAQWSSRLRWPTVLAVLVSGLAVAVLIASWGGSAIAISLMEGG
eukprot:5330275-Prymnesium_polylepis.1